MSKEQSKEKQMKILLLIPVIIITIISMCLAQYAWAKYMSVNTGQSQADVAKWYFDLKLKEGKSGATETTGPIDLASTQFNHVANDRIAPGTSGLFYVIVDTSDTEVDVLYNVDITLTNCPRNIKFYKADHADSNNVLSAGGVNNTSRTFSFSNYLEANGTNGNENDKYEQPIYWEWDYSGNVGGNTTMYDQWDTADAKLGTTNMTITATATQMLENPGQSGQSEEPEEPAVSNSEIHFSTSMNNVELDDWKVFYVDGSYTYIILDGYLPNDAIDGLITEYTDDVIDKFNTYNVWGNNRTNLINAMTTTSNWQELIDNGVMNGTPLSSDVKSDTTNVYAMGSPTLDLWVDSWNAKYESSARLYTRSVAQGEVTGQEDEYFDTGYAIGFETNPDSMYVNLLNTTGYNDELYFPYQEAIDNEDCIGYRLASHAVNVRDSLFRVTYNGLVAGNEAQEADSAFRPIIRLPSNIIN